MSRKATLFLALGTLWCATPARANQELALKKNCLGCHTLAQKRVGPSYREVAARYAADPAAATKLAAKIRSGGAGVWGQVGMPANPQVSEAEAKQLANWVLEQK